MKKIANQLSQFGREPKILALAFTAIVTLTAPAAWADAVTDWNQFTVEVTKGFNGSATTVRA